VKRVKTQPLGRISAIIAIVSRARSVLTFSKYRANGSSGCLSVTLAEGILYCADLHARMEHLGLVLTLTPIYYLYAERCRAWPSSFNPQ